MGRLGHFDLRKSGFRRLVFGVIRVGYPPMVLLRPMDLEDPVSVLPKFPERVSPLKES